jgi:hypothetical protein
MAYLRLDIASVASLMISDIYLFISPLLHISITCDTHIM